MTCIDQLPNHLRQWCHINGKHEQAPSMPIKHQLSLSCYSLDRLSTFAMLGSWKIGNSCQNHLTHTVGSTSDEYGTIYNIHHVYIYTYYYILCIIYIYICIKYNQNNKLNNLSIFTTPRAQLDLSMIHTAHPWPASKQVKILLQQCDAKRLRVVRTTHLDATKGDSNNKWISSFPLG